MAFIHNIVGPDEKLLGIARLHWIYAAKGLSWLTGFIFFGGFVKLYIGSILGGALAPVGSPVFWVCLVLGIVIFTIYIMMMLFTELGLTTKRCIYKRGWLFVDVREVDLEEIKSASIDNGILGRLLNYGYIQLDARFIGDIGLPAIKDPYRFIKALNDMRSNIKNDSMRVVLDQGVAGKAISPKQKRKEQKEADENLHHLQDDEYDAFSDDIGENTRGLMRDMENNVQVKKHIPSAKNSKSSKKSKVSPPEDLDDPLNKTMREHLKEEILDDFEEAEDEEAAEKIAQKS